MGTQTTVPCVQAEDSGLLGPLQSPNWVKVCLVSTVFFLQGRRLKAGTVVATLPGTWLCGISVWTCWAAVSKLWLGEIANLISNSNLNVATCKIVHTDPSVGYQHMVPGCQAAYRRTTVTVNDIFLTDDLF